VAATLLLWRLGERPLWLDEALTIANAEVPLFRIAELNGGNMVGYYAVVGEIDALRSSEFWLRVPSVIGMLAAVPVFAAIARRLADDRLAIIAVVLFALHPYVIEYGRVARSYTLVLLATLVSWWAFMELQRRASWRHAVVLTLATVAAAYLHLLALTLVPAQAAVALTTRRDRARDLRFGTSVLVTLVASTPLAFWALNPAASGPDWVRPTSFVQVLYGVSILAGSGHALSYTAVLFPAALLGAVVAVRSYGLRRAVPLAWAVVPIMTLAAISVWRPMFVSRYLIGVVPALVILAVLSVKLFTSSSSRVVWSGVLLSGALLGAASTQAPFDGADWRQAASALAQHPDDYAIIVPFDRTRTHLDLYWRWNPAQQPPEVLYPEGSAGAPRRLYGERELVDIDPAAHPRVLVLFDSSSDIQDPAVDRAVDVLTGLGYTTRGEESIAPRVTGVVLEMD
jgi:hypothetical protein